MKEIIPSILAKDRQELKEILRKYKNLEGPFHVDIGDGQFVNNTTVGLEEIEECLDKPFYVHLMVNKPEDITQFWLSLNNLKGIVFHIESTKDSLRLIEDIKSSNKEVLIAINPDTNIDLLNSVIDRIDGVHFMSVNPGFYGSPFIPEVIDRIKDFTNKNPNLIIQVDGGVSIDNISELSRVGVNRFVIGSYLLKSKDVGKAIEELKAKV